MYIPVYFINLPIVLLNYYWVSWMDPENSVGGGGGGPDTFFFYCYF